MQTVKKQIRKCNVSFIRNNLIQNLNTSIPTYTTLLLLVIKKLVLLFIIRQQFFFLALFRCFCGLERKSSSRSLYTRIWALWKYVPSPESPHEKLQIYSPRDKYTKELNPSTRWCCLRQPTTSRSQLRNRNLVQVITKVTLYLCTPAVNEWQLFRSWYAINSILAVFLK